MSTAGLPKDLIDALQALAEQPDPPPEPFERVARWRRACGDAEAAATWQTWSLLPPEPSELRSGRPVAQRGRDNGAAGVLARLKTASSKQVAATSRSGASRPKSASELQRQLLQHPPVLAIPELLDLLRLWQQQQQPQQALELLQPLLAFMQQRGEQPSGPICTAMADLLEQLKRFDEAEPWWQRSHAQQPQQAWPLMRLGHQALRKQQPAVALHYARQALEREPEHVFAPRLQRKALTALGATRSLQWLDQQEPTAADAIEEPPTQELWVGCRRLALIGFDDASLLEGWCQQLEAGGVRYHHIAPLQLWLIASPDPLAGASGPAAVPRPDPTAHDHQLAAVEPQRHGHLDLVLEASESAPFWREVQL